jgi:hypothetical protein
MSYFLRGETHTKAPERERISSKKSTYDETTPGIKAPKKSISGSLEKNEIKPFSKTIDLDRGIFKLLTNEGDKTMSKIEIEQKIKSELLNPRSMARLLTNLATYLESQ